MPGSACNPDVFLGRQMLFCSEPPTNASHVATGNLSWKSSKESFSDAQHERWEHQLNVRQSKKKRLSLTADSDSQWVSNTTKDQSNVKW